MRTVDPAKHRARRRELLVAAAEVFAAKGLDGATTREICTVAGTSAGALFHYFPSKRAMFAAIFEEDWDEEERRATAVLGAQDPVGALLEVVRRLAEPAGNAVVAAIVTEGMVQARRDPEIAEVMGRTDARDRAEIVGLLTRAAEQGAIDPPADIDSTATWILTIINACYLQALDPDADLGAQLHTLDVLMRRVLAVREP